jgi:hypothetical protein
MSKKQLEDLALAKELIQKYEELIPKCYANGASILANRYEKFLENTRIWVANMECN